jgi:hypothetical protein
MLPSVLIWMSYDDDIQPDRACAKAGSLMVIALRLNATASDRRAVDGVAAHASALQRQNRHTAAPVLR